MIRIIIGGVVEDKTNQDQTEKVKPLPKGVEFEPENPDDLAKSRLTKFDQEEPMIQFLLSKGYIPIVHSKTTYFRDRSQSNARLMPNEFGSGAQGTVYEVTKNGKRFAAKVSKHDDLGAEKEWIVRNKIEEIRRGLPTEVSKHIVRTFDFMKDKVFNGYVMEIMRPMSNEEQSLLYQGIGMLRSPSKYKGYPQDPKGKEPASQKFYNSYLSHDKYGGNDLTHEKQKEFIDALLYLVKHYNIRWSDMHSYNVMIRPTTRDYVATDIGLFNIPGLTDIQR